MSGNNAGRPSSKGMQNRKEKGNLTGQQFGRTFFHPPSGASNSALDHSGQGSSGPALIDHNQLLNQQFNTTGGQVASQIKIP